MSTSVGTYLVLALSMVSMLSSFQGVSASSFFYGHADICSSIPVPQVKAPLQVSGSTEVEEVKDIVLSGDSYSELPQSQLQFNQYLQSDPAGQQQWALEQIQAPPPRITEGNSQALVAVLDTGIDRAHEDLDGRVVAEINFTKSDTADDIYGHGTHVAGIIAANDDNNLGIIGLAPTSRLANVKVADDKGRCQVSALADGIIWAVDNGASVINISIELRESTSRLEEAVNYAWENGAIIVAAAGNDGNETPIYPAGYENCIGVTAIRENGELAPLANYGDWVDVAAPGFNIYSTLPDNSYGYKHGTSFATAYVSGLAALLFPMVADTNGNGRLNDEVRRAIETGCHEIGLDGTGKGCINVTSSIVAIDSILEYLP